MKSSQKRPHLQEASPEPDLTPEQRLLLAESLYQDVLKIQKKPWKPFWKSFASFKELERWKARQRDPRLW